MTSKINIKKPNSSWEGAFIKCHTHTRLRSPEHDITSVLTLRGSILSSDASLAVTHGQGEGEDEDEDEDEGTSSKKNPTN